MPLMRSSFDTPTMLHREFRVSTTTQQDSISPPSGQRFRVFAIHASQMVTSSLTSTLRATIAFGTGHTNDKNKILASYRQSKAEDTEAANMCCINVIGDVDEALTLTNMTFSSGEAITRAVIYYVIEK